MTNKSKEINIYNSQVNQVFLTKKNTTIQTVNHLHISIIIKVVIIIIPLHHSIIIRIVSILMLVILKGAKVISKVIQIKSIFRNLVNRKIIFHKILSIKNQMTENMNFKEQNTSALMVLLYDQKE